MSGRNMDLLVVSEIRLLLQSNREVQPLVYAPQRLAMRCHALLSSPVSKRYPVTGNY